MKIIKHKITKGETLSSISLKYYGNTRFWRRIYLRNKEVIGDSPHLIYPDQVLKIEVENDYSKGE